uniref:1-phosphatidylinositol 4-kinase n=2 Tax=Auxenochlorella protothecoides TaxID=3075 RepID=A0A1D2ACF6_AUXPR
MNGHRLPSPTQGDALSSVRLLVNQVVTSTDTKSAGAASSQLIQLLSSPASQHGSLDAVLLDLQPLLGPGNGNPSSTLLDAHSGLGAACAACLVQRIRDSPAPDQALGSLLRALPRPAAASLLRGLGLGSRAVNTSWGEAEWRAAAALAARGAAALDREEAGCVAQAAAGALDAALSPILLPASRPRGVAGPIPPTPQATAAMAAVGAAAAAASGSLEAEERVLALHGAAILGCLAAAAPLVFGGRASTALLLTAAGVAASLRVTLARRGSGEGDPATEHPASDGAGHPSIVTEGPRPLIGVHDALAFLAPLLTEAQRVAAAELRAVVGPRLGKRAALEALLDVDLGVPLTRGGGLDGAGGGLQASRPAHGLLLALAEVGAASLAAGWGAGCAAALATLLRPGASGGAGAALVQARAAALDLVHAQRDGGGGVDLAEVVIGLFASGLHAGPAPAPDEPPANAQAASTHEKPPTAGTQDQSRGKAPLALLLARLGRLAEEAGRPRAALAARRALFAGYRAEPPVVSPQALLRLADGGGAGDVSRAGQPPLEPALLALFLDCHRAGLAPVRLAGVLPALAAAAAACGAEERDAAWRRRDHARLWLAIGAARLARVGRVLPRGDDPATSPALGRLAAAAPDLSELGWRSEGPGPGPPAPATPGDGAESGRELEATLAALVGGVAGTPPATPSAAARLVALLTQELAAANHAPFSRLARPPGAALLAALARLDPGDPAAPWLERGLDQALRTMCLRARRETALGCGEEADAAAEALERAAANLVESLSEREAVVGAVPKNRPWTTGHGACALRLLRELTEWMPCLLYSRPVVRATLGLGGGGPDAPPAAQEWLQRMPRLAAARAPGAASAAFETVLMEGLLGPGSGESAPTLASPAVLPAMLALEPGEEGGAGHRGFLMWTAKVRALGAAQTQLRGLEGAAAHDALLAAAMHGLQGAGDEDQPLANRCLEAAALLILGLAEDKETTQDQAPSTPRRPGRSLLRLEGATPARALLRALCRAPLEAGDEGAAAAAAATAWHWLAAALGPVARSAVLEELAGAWRGAIAARRGIYAGGAAPHAGFAADAEAQRGAATAADAALAAQLPADAASLRAMRAQHLCVAFLLDARAALEGDARAEAQRARRTLAALSSAALEPGAGLGRAAAACATRFRLAQLALRCADAEPGAPAAQRAHRARVSLALDSALEWFDAPVAWHQADGAALREATRAVSAVQEAVARLPIWPASDRLSVEDAKQRLALLRFLLSSELERLAVWESPLDTKAHAAVACDWPTVAQWETLAAAAWIASPRLALALKDRFPGFPALRLELERFVLVNAAAKSLQLLPQAGALLAEMAGEPAAADKLVHLQSWAPLPLLQALAVVNSAGGKKPEVLEYLSRSLHECNPEEVAFFLPQLVQMLRTDHDGVVARFLLDAAAVSVHFAVVLACQLRSEGTPPDEAFDPQVRRSGWSAPKDSGLWQVADKLRTRLMSGLPEDVANLLKDELAYFDDITEVSGKLYPVHKDKRKSAAVEFLKAVELPRGDLFLPTNPDCTVLAHIPESAAPMQSAAKCPILVAFKVHVRQDVHPGFADGEVEEAGSQGSGKEDEEPETRACIFKVGDDCRQDILALQVIGLLKKAFLTAGLDLYLLPYGVIATGYECGIIEVIPNSKSRAQLGELTDGGLAEVFAREHGPPGTERHEAARQNFIRSCAGYAVASYLLQSKDRHNGNIMLDGDGHLLHIDFGFILGISPGGNLGFENAAFKLSYEMTEIIDPARSKTSPSYLHFKELCIKGFLTARSSAESIVATVAMMASSHLPCFRGPKTAVELRHRFRLDLGEKEAAAHMDGLVEAAYGRWTTGFYDWIQYLQNNIPK